MVKAFVSILFFLALCAGWVVDAMDAGRLPGAVRLPTMADDATGKSQLKEVLAHASA